MIAFIHHIGNTPRSGHYIVYIRKGERWFYYNADQVCAVPNDIAAQACLYCYQQRLGTA
ncbi:MAG: hypothetical protein AAF400_00355 [Bacteroidota bacterium]